MAYIKETLESLTTGTSITPADPGGYAAGDMLVFLVMAQNTSNNITTATSGWTTSSSAKGTYNNNSLGVVYKSAASGSETMPTITVGTSADIYALGVVLGDVPSSSAVDLELHGSTGFTTLTQSIPTGTTGAANTLGLWLCATSSWAETIPEVGSGPLGTDRNSLSSTNSGVSSGWWFEEASGVTSPSRDFWLLDTARNRHCIVISFKSDTAAIKPVRCDVDTVAPWDLICSFHDNDGYKGYTLTDISSNVTSLDGIASTAADTSTDNNVGFGLNLYLPGVRAQSANPATVGRAYVREYTLGTPVDLSAADTKIFFYVRYGSGTDLSRAETLANHGLMVGFRSGATSSEQYRFFDAAAFDTFPVGDGMQIVVIDPADVTNRVGSDIGGGTFDLSDIRGICTAFHSASTAVSQVYFDYCGRLNRLLLVGGDTSDSIHYLDWKAAKDQLRTYEQLIAQLGDTFESKISIQIGNGSDATYFHTNGQNFAFPNPADFDARTLQYQVYDNSHELVFELNTGDTATFDSPIDFKGGGLDISAAGNANATWVFNSAVWKNIGTWSTSDIGSIANLTIQGSASLDNEALDLSGGNCVVTDSSGTSAVVVTGATEEALQTALASFNDCAINNSTVALRIEYTGTGDISLIVNGTTFSGNTTDVHYNSTNASQLTITPSNGTVITTTAFSGSATGVTVDSSTAITLSAPNLIDGTRYQIYNVTKSTELYNAIVSGGAGISIATLIGVGLDIEEGDLLRLRGTYQSGSNYRTPFESSIVANTSSNVWTNSQTVWTVVESYGLDGSAYDNTASGGTGPFTGDFTNEEVDYALTSNFTGAQFGSWVGYILTTSSGIADWYGGFTFIDAANIQINDVSTAVTGLFDNQTTSEVYQTDSIRIFLESGGRPVKNPSTGGGGIDINWKNQVYLQTTGSVALSAAQASQLLADSATAAAGVGTVETKVDSVASEVSEIHTRNDLNAAKPQTYADDESEISNADFTLTKGDNGDGTFTVTRS